MRSLSLYRAVVAVMICLHLCALHLSALPQTGSGFQANPSSAQTQSPVRSEHQERLKYRLNQLDRENRRDSVAILLLCDVARELSLHTPQEARVYAERAIAYTQALKPHSAALAVESSLTLALVLQRHGKAQKALLVADSLIRYESRLSGNPALWADVYCVLGRISVDVSKRREALKHFATSLQYAENIGDTVRIVRALSGLTQNAVALADSQASLYLRRLLNIARKHPDSPHIQAEIALTEAQYYLRLSDYARSLTHALEALKIYEQLSEEVYICNALLAVINTYSFQFAHSPSEIKKCQEYLRRARALGEQLGNKQHLFDAYNFTGLAFENLNLYDSAFAYSQQSLEMAQELGNPTNVITGYTNTGVLLWRLGKPKEGLERLRTALRKSEEHGLVRFMIVPLVRISSILRTDIRTEGRHRAAEALPYALRAFRIADSVGNRLRKEYALTELAAVYDSLGRIRDAYNALQAASLLKDTLFSKETAEKSLQLQTEYDSERKDSEIQLLQKDKELQALAFREQRIAQYSLAALFVFALGAALVLAWLYRQKERAAAEILRQQNILEEQTAEIETVNETLNEQNERLRLLNQEKSDIMNIVSHDLKNPISAMQGFADLLHSADTLDADEVHLLSGQMMQTSERMLKLVINLLDVNRLETGEVEFVMQEFPLTPLVESIVELHRPSAAEKNIHLHFENMTPNSTVYADEQAAIRILDNLLSNAVKYSPKEKNIYVRVKDKGLTAPLSPSAFIRVEVADEGQGISPEDMKKMFGKFARLSARPTGGEHSTGLGLSIVKQLVEAMHGRVWCESIVSDGLPTGATFIVELPTAPR